LTARRPLRSQFLPILLRGARSAGLTVQPLMRHFSLPSDGAERRELSVPIRVVQELPDLIAHEVGDPLLGLHAAGSLARGSYGLFEFTVRTATTVREACFRVSRYSTLLDELTVCTFEEHRGEAILSMRVPGERHCYGRHGNELVVGFLSRLLF